jgi:hypothetical protein
MVGHLLATDNALLESSAARSEVAGVDVAGAVRESLIK